jgi:iron complex outermembrane receptor protein
VEVPYLTTRPLEYALVLFAVSQSVHAQQTASITGTVSLASDGSRLHNASVVLPQLRRTTETRSDGTYEFRNVPPGAYTVAVHMHALTDESKTVIVKAGETARADFSLGIAGLKQQITVTAAGREETMLETFQSVTSVEGLQAAARTGSTSLGDLLENENGIAKRSFGPGTTRPVIRGFDGDRVLVLQDGVRTGTLGSQSGDHGEPVEPTSFERVEVVRGPATLLYGSNAIGGVVNVISRHHELHEHPHEGVRGSVSGTGGTTNAQGGGAGNLEYGRGGYLFWGGGAGMRTGDYHTPIGAIENSHTRLEQATAGFGRYGERASYTLNYNWQQGRYGVPFDHEHDEHDHGHVDLDWRRHSLRGLGTLRNLGPALEQFTAIVNYSDWNHNELEGDEIGTRFFNSQFTYQGAFQQRPYGPLSGTFGFWGLKRDFEAIGPEALAPPTGQNAIAVFALEQLNFERIRFQFGGRLENNRYDPDGLESRSFTGFSGSAGVNVPLWKNGVAVANVTSSYRAPALEELYNNGPHPGNLAFEIGNPDLLRERANGVEASLKHQGARVRAEANAFFYRFSDYVFLAPTGQVEEGLNVARYAQANTRYMGAEARLDTVVHSNVTLNLGADLVDAQLRDTHVPLPRIPPARGRIGLDFHRGGLSIRPELVLSNGQWQVFPNETETSGYALVNLGASYTVASQHRMHVLSAYLFNAADRLYRNHLSFIKEYAPEIGRGVRVSYTMHFF